MAVDEIRDYIENGNIKNSVNYPALDMGVCNKASRVSVAHKNVPNIISALTTACGVAGVNIAEINSKAKGDYAYTIMDLDSVPTDEVLDQIAKTAGVIKVRKVK